MESGSSVSAVTTSYYSARDKMKFSIGGTSLEFFKVDDNAKVRGQNLNSGLPE